MFLLVSVCENIYDKKTRESRKIRKMFSHKRRSRFSYMIRTSPFKYPFFLTVLIGFPYRFDDQQLLWTAGLQVFTLVCNELFSAFHTPEKKLTVRFIKYKNV